MSPLKQHVIIVTGAARGIGKSIAETVARQGGHVIVTDILTDEAEAVASGIAASGGSATAFTLDITRPEDAEAVAGKILERFGRIDGLVNNAALDAPHGRAWEIGADEWRHVIEVDLNGAWYCSRAVIPAMRMQRRGRIVFISSIAARLGSPHLSPAYSTAKAGLIGLTVSLSAQLESDGILVNAITPGLIYNDFLRKIYPAEFFDGYAENRSLVGRVGRPEDVASLVSFLLSDKAGYITGEVYGISGGVHPHG